MPDSWKQVRLGDVLEVIHGYAFSGESMSEELTGKPVIVSIGNFNYHGGFRFESTRVREFTKEYPTQFDLSPGDLLVAMTCQTPDGEILGLPGRVPDDGKVYLHNQRIGKVLTNRDAISVGFAYYCFLWKEVNRQLVATASGTKILHTAPSRIAAVNISLPPLWEQEAIADVLGALDAKIVLNDSLSRTAMDLARAHLRGAVESDDKDEAELSSAVKFLNRGVAPCYTEDEEQLRVLNQKCVRGGRVSFGPSRRTLADKVTAAKLLRVNDVLVNSTGMGTLGRVARWTKDEACTVDSHVTIVRFDEARVDPVCAGFSMLEMEPEIEALGEGSTGQTELSRTQLSALRIILPSRERSAKLRLALDALQSRCDAALGESEALAELRDTLLPKFMSGEIRVRDAEKVVEDVVL
jgi:type I restriction enzyme, S subunit